ncbi:MAG: endo-1,4-beta-xylanase [Muribaculaceae bacterium]|nr:endo-1,4-beta-xylanase [Muribaculaceae bacterium]
MKPTAFISLLAFSGAVLCSCAENATAEPAVKDVFGDKFLIGTALNVRQSNELDSMGVKIVKQHFNNIVAENCMKSEEIHPQRDTYFWDDADRFVEFGMKNNLVVSGHCLIWHSQLAPWFPYDDNGNYVSADTLKQRMRDHIYTVMRRYKGKVKGWDVVNEAILDDGSYRVSPFYEIIGEEFIPLAFQYAHEADPDAELYINDYSMANKGKRDKYVEIVNDLKKRGLRIDAIGMQGHMGLDYPELSEFEKSIEAFASTGCKVMITEWDMSALPTVNRGANVADRVEFEKQMNPYPDGLPEDVSEVWNNRMEQFFELALKHSDKISRINFWGVSDGDSWKNNWPMAGRKEYPLLFDRNYEMKPFMKKLIEKYSAV